jgi:ABC-type lipoprotein export system ATPase subunit
LSIKHGEFVCIIGDVGSGKSSLLSALIGDLLYIDEDFLKTYGNTAFSEEDEEFI